MKSRKIFLSIVNVSILIMIFLLMGSVAQAKTPKAKDIETAIDLSCEYCYPTVGKVIKVRKEKVFVSEVGGNVFAFKCKDAKVYYHKGDVVAMWMYDNGTPLDETDDEIVKSINYGKGK